MFSKEVLATCKHSQQWLPVLALYTGARQTELAQLLITDVVQIDGIWCLNITDQGNDQKLKTKLQCIVPIHKGLIAQGFLDYFRDIEKSKHKQLWPTLKPGRYGWEIKSPSGSGIH
ncbi:MAG: hypothetical protein IPG06_20595 [Haliea sp.]|nr:hypothetical protein [Haliea sp.]